MEMKMGEMKMKREMVRREEQRKTLAGKQKKRKEPEALCFLCDNSAILVVDVHLGLTKRNKQTVEKRASLPVRGVHFPKISLLSFLIVSFF